MHRLRPEESVAVAKGFAVTHGGYGHRLTEEGDRPFFSLTLTSPEGTEDVRVYYPLERPEVLAWGALELHVTKCEDEGPPHSRTAAIEFLVQPRPRLPLGTPFALELGRSALLEDGLRVEVSGVARAGAPGGPPPGVMVELQHGKATEVVSLTVSAPGRPSPEVWRRWAVQLLEVSAPESGRPTVRLVVQRRP